MHANSATIASRTRTRLNAIKTHSTFVDSHGLVQRSPLIRQLFTLHNPLMRRVQVVHSVMLVDTVAKNFQTYLIQTGNAE